MIFAFFQVAAELQLCKEHSALMGAIQMFLTTSNPHANTSSLVSVQQLATTEGYNTLPNSLHQSSSAKSASSVVVDVIWPNAPLWKEENKDVLYCLCLSFVGVMKWRTANGEIIKTRMMRIGLDFRNCLNHLNKY